MSAGVRRPPAGRKWCRDLSLKDIRLYFMLFCKL